MRNQNDIEYLQDLLSRGKITVDEANIQMVLDQRVRIVSAPLPRNVRNALTKAVKCGKLGYYRKEGFKPEAFFNPQFDYLARAERNRIKEETIALLKKYGGFPTD